MSQSQTIVPEGFVPFLRSSPLLEALGGFYSTGAQTNFRFGLLVGEKHCNSRGKLHGGVIATLADVGVGYHLSYATVPPLRMVTTSMTLDYVASAKIGDWIEVQIESTDSTKRLQFASARLVCQDRIIARARAVFTVTTTNSSKTD